MSDSIEDQNKIALRIRNTIEAIRQCMMDNLWFIQGKFPRVATKNDYYLAIAYTIRDRLLGHWTKSAETFLTKESRTVCYLSAEFLLGPQLANNLLNLGIYKQVKQASESLGLNLDEIIAQEVEPGLGNGGLGRLAACFMDSLATLEIPSIGYGIRYEFGIFKQEIHDGWQVETTDKWLHFGNPWEIPRPEVEFDIPFGGHVIHFEDKQGRYRAHWEPEHMVKGIAYDTPIVGYQSINANFLRLFRAEACDSFNFKAFNVGDYYNAVYEKVTSENITKVLYPNDEPLVGKQLRLQQQYFFVSCSLQDMIRLYTQREKTLDNFHFKFAVQLNDTHPALAIPELMRLLVDVHNLDWDKAWHITENTFGFTNHTLLSEALEKWPVSIFEKLLPRHYEIILEINQRFLDIVRTKYPHDNERLKRMSIIEESQNKQVRMANLACVGSHAINGVAALHTKLLQESVLKDFYEFWPHKFSNKTNGITPRRFLALCNHQLALLISEHIGDGWLKDLTQLRQLEPLATDANFQEKWQKIKLANKTRLAELIQHHLGLTLNPNSLFDIQAKRIHEYKRQHFNVLHAITLYQQIKKNPGANIVPRTIIFSGKAAPGYYMAKLIIKFIHSVADIINHDEEINDKLKIIFLPNFNVKNAQIIYPAADLSEQISTAGKEASGTGNMKFALNGALTIGTLDGANIEIRNAVGEENFFLFGLTAEQIVELKQKGYRPTDLLKTNNQLREIIDWINAGVFSHGDANLFKPIMDNILNEDPYMLLADYSSYMESQQRVNNTYQNQTEWTKMSILNVARMGYFSSDRTIKEYCQEIWNVKPEPIS